MAATQASTLFLRDSVVDKQYISDTAVTLNGATAVTTSLTFSRAFSVTPRVLGVGVVGSGKAITCTVSAISTTAITLSACGLSGDTDTVTVFATIEGQY